MPSTSCTPGPLSSELCGWPGILIYYFILKETLFLKKIIYFVCVHVCACVHPTRELECTRRPEEGVSLLELELQAVVCHILWALGTELGSLREQPRLRVSALLCLSNPQESHLTYPPGVSRVPRLWANPAFHYSEADTLLNHSDH